MDCELIPGEACGFPKLAPVLADLIVLTISASVQLCWDPDGPKTVRGRPFNSNVIKTFPGGWRWRP